VIRLRERKLRAWVIKEEKMYYDNVHLVPMANYIYGEDVIEWYVYYYIGNECEPICLGQLGTEVIVMDFVNQQDKDNKEIYEGDILRHYVGANYYVIGLVVWGGKWNYSAFGIGGKRPKELKTHHDDPEYYWDFLNKELVKKSEIIGNDCENPELLQGQICKRERGR
jgi:hypothetical protein